MRLQAVRPALENLQTEAGNKNSQIKLREMLAEDFIADRTKAKPRLGSEVSG
jgi:hypothetical protein